MNVVKLDRHGLHRVFEDFDPHQIVGRVHIDLFRIRGVWRLHHQPRSLPFRARFRHIRHQETDVVYN
jgi:hypothetical protein